MNGQNKCTKEEDQWMDMKMDRKGRNMGRWMDDEETYALDGWMDQWTKGS